MVKGYVKKFRYQHKKDVSSWHCTLMTAAVYSKNKYFFFCFLFLLDDLYIDQLSTTATIMKCFVYNLSSYWNWMNENRLSPLVCFPHNFFPPYICAHLHQICKFSRFSIRYYTSVHILTRRSMRYNCNQLVYWSSYSVEQFTSVQIICDLLVNKLLYLNHLDIYCFISFSLQLHVRYGQVHNRS